MKKNIKPIHENIKYSKVSLIDQNYELTQEMNQVLLPFINQILFSNSHLFD